MLSEVGAFQMSNSFVKLDYWNFTLPYKFSKSKGKFPNNELPSDKIMKY